MTIDLGIFGFSGISKIQQEFFYNVVQIDPDTREGYLQMAVSLGSEF